MYDTAILIGRFEPVHTGHLALLREALACAQRVIVIVGSAFQARTPKNPFTWAERESMLRSALTAHDNARLTVLPVRDYYNEALWVQAVRSAVARHTAAHGRVGLVGHFKDATSSYLRAFPGWELIRMERQGDIDATAIRDAYFGATPTTVAAALQPLASAIPPSTRALLEQFANGPSYAALQQEWLMLRSYREAWATAPYPPVFVTVDAVLRCQDQVLLIRRAHAPGKGQLAVPGGFIEQRETLWQSCLRELAEETHCALPEADMQAALQCVAVFDHPDRSQRGRTITHAHYFDLGQAPLPDVRADDDAAQVQWTPIGQLAGMEEDFFEDHFHMLDHFLGLTTRQ
ncbi:bifunctional nicotinamide-nucleotide adenylyltransferase/Nudix hydroxylase [Diaphorobacter sp.]|uniref:bifunctional nicotinamide-nucleotide adenylyltransferase/Nudix hydroxylase n=1 Tax=Diaphorobacter sp. TaxID=1934310 RepID=UPI003D0D7842